MRKTQESKEDKGKPKSHLEVIQDCTLYWDFLEKLVSVHGGELSGEEINSTLNLALLKSLISILQFHFDKHTKSEEEKSAVEKLEREIVLSYKKMFETLTGKFHSKWKISANQHFSNVVCPLIELLTSSNNPSVIGGRESQIQLLESILAHLREEVGRLPSFQLEKHFKFFVSEMLVPLLKLKQALSSSKDNQTHLKVSSLVEEFMEISMDSSPSSLPSLSSHQILLTNSLNQQTQSPQPNSNNKRQAVQEGVASKKRKLGNFDLLLEKLSSLLWNQVNTTEASRMRECTLEAIVSMTRGFFSKKSKENSKASNSVNDSLLQFHFFQQMFQLVCANGDSNSSSSLSSFSTMEWSEEFEKKTCTLNHLLSLLETFQVYKPNVDLKNGLKMSKFFTEFATTLSQILRKNIIESPVSPSLRSEKCTSQILNSFSLLSKLCLSSIEEHLPFLLSLPLEKGDENFSSFLEESATNFLSETIFKFSSLRQFEKFLQKLETSLLNSTSIRTAKSSSLRVFDCLNFVKRFPKLLESLSLAFKNLPIGQISSLFLFFLSSIQKLSQSKIRFTGFASLFSSFLQLILLTEETIENTQLEQKIFQAFSLLSSILKEALQSKPLDWQTVNDCLNLYYQLLDFRDHFIVSFFAPTLHSNHYFSPLQLEFSSNSKQLKIQHVTDLLEYLQEKFVMEEGAFQFEKMKPPQKQIFFFLIPLISFQHTFHMNNFLTELKSTCKQEMGELNQKVGRETVERLEKMMEKVFNIFEKILPEESSNFVKEKSWNGDYVCIASLPEKEGGSSLVAFFQLVLSHFRFVLPFTSHKHKKMLSYFIFSLLPSQNSPNNSQLANLVSKLFGRADNFEPKVGMVEILLEVLEEKFGKIFEFFGKKSQLFASLNQKYNESKSVSFEEQVQQICGLLSVQTGKVGNEIGNEIEKLWELKKLANSVCILPFECLLPYKTLLLKMCLSTEVL